MQWIGQTGRNGANLNGSRTGRSLLPFADYRHSAQRKGKQQKKSRTSAGKTPQRYHGAFYSTIPVVFAASRPSPLLCYRPHSPRAASRLSMNADFSVATCQPIVLRLRVRVGSKQSPLPLPLYTLLQLLLLPPLQLSSIISFSDCQLSHFH